MNNFMTGYPYGGVVPMAGAPNPYGYPLNNPYLTNINNLQAQHQNLQQQNSQNPNSNNQQQNMGQPQQYSVPVNTNIIYVNDENDVRNRQLLPNSNFAFFDNDKPIVYRKHVDATGKMSVEKYDIIPHKDEPAATKNDIDMTKFVSISDFNALKKEIEQLKSEIKQSVQEQPKQVVKSLNTSYKEV